MDPDSVVLGGSVALVAAFAAGVTLFFGRLRLHRRPRTWARVLAGNLLVFGLLLSLGLLGGELYYRYVYDSTAAIGLTRTTGRWFQRHVRSNNFGFRDSLDYAHAIAPGRRRVTLLGDSFTIGHGIRDVEQRFGNRVRRALPDLEVHMVAQAGWNTSHEGATLVRMTKDGYQLDLVVLIYCLNDIADIVPEWQEVLERIHAHSQRGFLVRHSFLLNTLHYRWRATHDPDIARYFDVVLRSYEGPIWDEQRARLRLLRDVVAAAGGRLAIVTFPFLHDLGTDYPHRDVHRRLDALWRELGVPHLDLLATLEPYGRSELVVNRYDPHPNERANELAAQALLPFLRELLAR